MQVTKGTLHMHKRCVSGAASDFFLCETSMGQTEQVILIENSQAGSNILSISVQASQVSCIVREIHTFMGHLTLTCMDTQISRNFSVPSAARYLSLVYSCKPTKVETPLIKSIVTFPIPLGNRLRCGSSSLSSNCVHQF